MLYISQVKYKMFESDEWREGWLVGAHANTAKTLLDSSFRPIPNIKDDVGEFMCYDIKYQADRISIQI